MNMDEFLKILVCPSCRGSLTLEKMKGGASAFFCEHCRLLYPIENEIPIMLVDRAISVETMRDTEK